YFLMTGKLPFDRHSFLEMLHAHAYEPLVPGPEFQESVPADLQYVLLRCLEKDPERRIPDALTLEKALAACKGVGEWTRASAEAGLARVASPHPEFAAAGLEQRRPLARLRRNRFAGDRAPSRPPGLGRSEAGPARFGRAPGQGGPLPSPGPVPAG